MMTLCVLFLIGFPGYLLIHVIARSRRNRTCQPLPIDWKHEFKK